MSKIASHKEGVLAESDRRSFPRLKVPMLWRSPGVVANFSRAQNMSLGGARVFSDEKMKINRKLNLELLAGPDSTVQILARVAWIDELGKDAPARFDVGLEFLDVPEEMISRLADILKKDEEYLRQMETPEPPDPVWADDEEEDEKKQ